MREQQEVEGGELYRCGGKTDVDVRVFAVAQLCFAHAAATKDQSYYLSSAVFAYAFLFPENSKDVPDPYDPRLRLAVDLYNQGLANGLAAKDGSGVDLSQRQPQLPFGSFDLQVHQS